MKGNPNLILLESLLSRCRDGVLSREIPVIIPLGQARPRPPEFGQFHLQTELFYQVSGSTCFQFPTSEYILGPNRVLLVPPLVTHYEKVRGPDAEFQNLVAYAGKRSCSVHLAKAGLDKRPTIAFIQRRSPPYTGHMAEYLADAIALQEEFHENDKESPIDEPVRLLVAASLSHFLLALRIDGAPIHSAVSAPWQEGGGGSSLVHEARERVLAALSDKTLSVQLLAEWLSCSADYLSHRYKAETGEGLTIFISRTRLERAAELLNDTTLSVKEISWACGFAEESYFIRKFNDFFGCTPGQYRRTNRDLLPSSLRGFYKDQH